MFDFWYELPPILRVGFGLLLIIIAVGIYLVTRRVFAVGLGCVGLMFILFSGAGNDKGGYKF